jgi:hypothetical protein
MCACSWIYIELAGVLMVGTVGWLAPLEGFPYRLSAHHLAFSLLDLYSWQMDRNSNNVSE